MPPLSVDSTGVLNERLGRHGAARRVVPLPLAALLLRGRRDSEWSAALATAYRAKHYSAEALLGYASRREQQRNRLTLAMRVRR
jgi:hypothetical protein